MTQFLTPSFAIPYNNSGVVPSSSYDATVHAQILWLFGGITQNTKTHVAMHHWYFDSISSVRKDPAYVTKQISSIIKQRIIDKAPEDQRLAAFYQTQIILDSAHYSSAVKTELEKAATVTMSNKTKLLKGKSDAKMHCKFFLFSELQVQRETWKYVIAQTSANIRHSQYKEANDLLVMHGNKKLYDTYLEYWHEIHKHRDKGQDRTWKDVEADDVKFYFLPRKGDTIAGALNNLLKENQLSQQADRKPKYKPSVYIAMTYFNSSRKNVAEKLVELQEKGINVNVILSREKSINNIGTYNILKKGGVSVRYLPNYKPGKEVWSRYQGRMHCKYMLLDGHYNLDGKIKRRKMVWVGSTNYTGVGMYASDETLIRVENDHVYGAYLDNWTHLNILAFQNDTGRTLLLLIYRLMKLLRKLFGKPY